MDPSAKPIARQPGCEETIEQAERLLSAAGLQVARTFDLRSIGADCPYHGGVPCECQLVMFLVYGEDAMPATLIGYSCDGQTVFSVVDAPYQPVDPQLEAAIAHTLAPDNFIRETERRLAAPEA